MKKEKLRRIESKAKLGLPLTTEERSFYILYSKVVDMSVANAAVESSGVK